MIQQFFELHSSLIQFLQQFLQQYDFQVQRYLAYSFYLCIFNNNFKVLPKCIILLYQFGFGIDKTIENFLGEVLKTHIKYGCLKLLCSKQGSIRDSPIIKRYLKGILLLNF